MGAKLYRRISCVIIPKQKNKKPALISARRVLILFNQISETQLYASLTQTCCFLSHWSYPPLPPSLPSTLYLSLPSFL